MRRSESFEVKGWSQLENPSSLAAIGVMRITLKRPCHLGEKDVPGGRGTCGSFGCGLRVNDGRAESKCQYRIIGAGCCWYRKGGGISRG